MQINLKKQYKNNANVFDIEAKTNILLGEINVVFGSSGSGKTSFLRLLSGLDTGVLGSIKTKENVWLDSERNIHVSPSKRSIAFVFTQDNLFSNMSVFKNITYVKKNYNPSFLKELCQAMQIDDLLTNKVDTLSSGQKQRVALAAALIQEKDFLFLDESLSALDNDLRKKIQIYLRELQKVKKFTVLMITHSVQEVIALAKHVIVFKKGKVIKQGNANETIIGVVDEFLKAIVVDMDSDDIVLLIGNQKTKVNRKKVQTTSFEIGDVVEVIL